MGSSGRVVVGVAVTGSGRSRGRCGSNIPANRRAAYAFGTWLALDAFGLIAILVLHAGPTEVSVLAAAGLAVGAAVAVPLGPWVEFRRKRPVMVAMDLTRFAALMSIPAAFTLGWLSFAQLLVVSERTRSVSIRIQPLFHQLLRHAGHRRTLSGRVCEGGIADFGLRSAEATSWIGD
jgi:hypothetical protein